MSKNGKMAGNLCFSPKMFYRDVPSVKVNKKHTKTSEICFFKLFSILRMHIKKRRNGVQFAFFAKNVPQGRPVFAKNVPQGRPFFAKNFPQGLPLIKN